MEEEKKVASISSCPFCAIVIRFDMLGEIFHTVFKREDTAPSLFNGTVSWKNGKSKILWKSSSYPELGNFRSSSPNRRGSHPTSGLWRTSGSFCRACIWSRRHHLMKKNIQFLRVPILKPTINEWEDTLFSFLSSATRHGANWLCACNKT